MNHKRIILASFIATVIAWLAMYAVGSSLRLFVVLCKSGVDCPSGLDLFLSYSIILLPLLFLFVLGIAYLLSHILGKGK